MTIPQVPTFPLDQADTEDQDWVLGEPERRALELAAATGERVAAWIRTLAERQQERSHRQCLHAAAETVQQVMGWEIVPGSDGELFTEARHWLDAYMVLPAIDTECGPELSGAELVTLLAVGAVVCTAPTTVLRDLAFDLPSLCEVIDLALASIQSAEE